MGLMDLLGLRKKDLTLEQVKREEIRLTIRENQALARLEKLEREREEIFARGAKVKSPARRRQLARLYEAKSAGLKTLERELAVLSKELTTLSALKLALERREMSREGVSRLLDRISEARLVTLLEDDKISQEMYLEKLGSVLSTVAEGAAQITEQIGNEGREVLEVWEKMDEGEIGNFEEGFKLADRKVRERRPEAELESE